MSLLNDRLTRGFTAGLMGFILLSAFNFIMYYLKISELRYLDFAAVFIYGHTPNSTLETVFAYLVAAFFTSGLGIFFAYIISSSSHRNIVLKGTIFSVGMWFSFYAITILFKIPELHHINLLTAFSNLIGSIIWGIALGYFLWWLDNKGKEKLAKIKR